MTAPLTLSEGPSSESAPATRNYLLAAVRNAAPQLATLLERVELGAGQLIAAAGEPVGAVYFPETAVISLITVMRDGAAMEAAAIGNEGVVGLGIVLGVDGHERRTVAQVPGHAVRVPADALRATLLQQPKLHTRFLRYTDALLLQAMQSGACTKLHSMPKRCARWLLMTHDRVGADTFWLTQQYLAFMLAVRRATVNAIAGALQREGLIRYQRGRVTILDRRGLEAASCECYTVIRRAYDRQLVDEGPDEGPDEEPSGGASELGA